MIGLSDCGTIIPLTNWLIVLYRRLSDFINSPFDNNREFQKKYNTKFLQNCEIIRCFIAILNHFLPCKLYFTEKRTYVNKWKFCFQCPLIIYLGHTYPTSTMGHGSAMAMQWQHGLLWSKRLIILLIVFVTRQQRKNIICFDLFSGLCC
jgi:hypothetical protein